MKPYKNKSGDSGISAYEEGTDWIRVRFVTGKMYTYSEESAGRKHINKMKKLANDGKGLASYISKYTWDLYVRPG